MKKTAVFISFMFLGLLFIGSLDLAGAKGPVGGGKPSIGQMPKAPPPNLNNKPQNQNKPQSQFKPNNQNKPNVNNQNKPLNQTKKPNPNQFINQSYKPTVTPYTPPVIGSGNPNINKGPKTNVPINTVTPAGTGSGVNYSLPQNPTIGAQNNAQKGMDKLLTSVMTNQGNKGKNIDSPGGINQGQNGTINGGEKNHLNQHQVGHTNIHNNIHNKDTKTTKNDCGGKPCDGGGKDCGGGDKGGKDGHNNGDKGGKGGDGGNSNSSSNSNSKSDADASVNDSGNSTNTNNNTAKGGNATVKDSGNSTIKDSGNSSSSSNSTVKDSGNSNVNVKTGDTNTCVSNNTSVKTGDTNTTVKTGDTNVNNTVKTGDTNVKTGDTNVKIGDLSATGGTGIGYGGEGGKATAINGGNNLNLSLNIDSSSRSKGGKDGSRSRDSGFNNGSAFCGSGFPSIGGGFATDYSPLRSYEEPVQPQTCDSAYPVFLAQYPVTPAQPYVTEGAYQAYLASNKEQPVEAPVLEDCSKRTDCEWLGYYFPKPSVFVRIFNNLISRVTYKCKGDLNLLSDEEAKKYENHTKLYPEEWVDIKVVFVEAENAFCKGKILRCTKNFYPAKLWIGAKEKEDTRIYLPLDKCKYLITGLNTDLLKKIKKMIKKGKNKELPKPIVLEIMAEPSNKK